MVEIGYFNEKTIEKYNFEKNGLYMRLGDDETKPWKLVAVSKFYCELSNYGYSTSCRIKKFNERFVKYEKN